MTTASGRKNSATRVPRVHEVAHEAADRALVADRQEPLVAIGERLALPGEVGPAGLAGALGRVLALAGGGGTGQAAALRGGLAALGVGRPLGASG
ncbi:hypothetical protein GCM10020221_31450 [Streptomyces thioluteus]|uniref:Uncharacterized protein n=1 Tax=Streptomyces thioluteus TaxID=66431 RepID=A0ABP6JHY5_STRTU